MNLVRQIRRDPEAGVRRLLAECGPGLYAVALRLCGDHAAADDLYARALERGIERIAQHGGPGLYLWLRAILENLHRSDLRRAGRNLPHAEGVVDLDSLPGSGPSPFADLVARSDAEAVQHAVSELPRLYRLPVLLHYWRDRSVDEVARDLHLPVGTVKTRLSRARALLRVALSPHFQPEDLP